MAFITFAAFKNIYMNKKFLSGLGVVLMLAASCSKEKMLVKENIAGKQQAVSSMSLKPKCLQQWTDLGHIDPSTDTFGLIFTGVSNKQYLDCNKTVSLWDALKELPTSALVEMRIIDGRLYVKLKDQWLVILKSKYPEMIDVQQIALAQFVTQKPANGIIVKPLILVSEVYGFDMAIIACAKPTRRTEIFEIPSKWQNNLLPEPDLHPDLILPDGWLDNYVPHFGLYPREDGKSSMEATPRLEKNILRGLKPEQIDFIEKMKKIKEKSKSDNRRKLLINEERFIGLELLRTDVLWQL